MRKNLYIFGCSGIAKSMIDSISRLKNNSPDQIFLVDANKDLSGTTFYDNYPVIHLDELELGETQGNSAIAAYFKPRDIYKRNIEFEEVLRKYNLNRISIIDPAVSVSPSAEIGAGVYIAPNTVVDANAKVCDDSIVLFNTVVSREVTVGKNVFISASVVIKGSVTIGDSTFISAGCLVTKDIEGQAFINAGVMINDVVSSNTIIGNKSSIMTVNLPKDIASAERRLRFFHP